MKELDTTNKEQRLSDQVFFKKHFRFKEKIAYE